MTSWNRSEYADRIRRAVQNVLSRNHVEYSCFVVTGTSSEPGGPYRWEIVAMTSRGKAAFTIETTAFDTDLELAAKAEVSVERCLPLLVCPTCKGAGYLKAEPKPELEPIGH